MMPKGSWEPIILNWPTNQPVHRAIHLVLVHHDSEWKVLAFGDGEGPRDARFTTCHLFRLEDVPDPSKAQVIISEETDIFCAGHCHMEDGNVLFAGGGFIPGHSKPPLDVNVLDLSQTPPVFRRLRSMNRSRWYPTCTMLMEGQVLITSGYEEHWRNYGDFRWTVQIPELYDPFINACLHVPTTNRHERSPWNAILYQPLDYPFMFVNLGGGIIEVGPGPFSGWLSTTNWWWFWEAFRWRVDDLRDNAGTGPSSAVIIQPGLYMRCGGGSGAGPGGVAFDRTAVINVDRNAGQPWTPGPPWYWEEADTMNIARRHHDLVLLPDQTVLAVGGAKTDFTTGSAQCRQAEVFDVFDDTQSPFGTWRMDDEEPEMAMPRGYHSTALLLPDARVLVAGGEAGTDGGITINPLTAEIYNPPYLFGDPPRVEITAAPQRIGYDTEHQMTCEMKEGPTDYKVTKVCLIRLGAVTHGFDQDQRYVPLEFESEPLEPPPDSPIRLITFTGPRNAAHAPPGPYMLWVLTDNEDFPDMDVPCKLAAHVFVGDERATLDLNNEDQFEGKTIFEVVQGAELEAVPPERAGPQPRGSLWNPDKRYYAIMPEGGEVTLQVHAKERPAPSLKRIQVRIVSRSAAEAPIPVTVELWNWNAAVNDWVTIFQGTMSPFVDDLIWAEPAGVADDFVHQASGRLRARIKWAELESPVHVNEITWVLQHDL